MATLVPYKTAAGQIAVHRQQKERYTSPFNPFAKLTDAASDLLGRLIPFMSTAEACEINLDMSGDSETLDYLAVATTESLNLLTYYRNYPKHVIVSPNQLFLLYQIIGFTNKDLSVTSGLRALVSTCLFVLDNPIRVADSRSRLECVSELQCVLTKKLPMGTEVFITTDIRLPVDDEQPRGNRLQLVPVDGSKRSPGSDSFESSTHPSSYSLALTDAFYVPVVDRISTPMPFAKTHVPFRFMWSADLSVYEIDPLFDYLLIKLPLLIWAGQPPVSVIGYRTDPAVAMSFASDLRIRSTKGNPIKALHEFCEEAVLPVIQQHIASIIRRVNDIFESSAKANVEVVLSSGELQAIHSLRAVAAAITYPQLDFFDLKKLKNLSSADKGQVVALSVEIIPALVSFSDAVGHRLLTKPSWDVEVHWTVSILKALLLLQRFDPYTTLDEKTGEDDLDRTIADAVEFLKTILTDNNGRHKIIDDFGEKALTNPFHEFAIRRLLIYVVCELTNQNLRWFNVDEDVEIERQAIAIVQRYILYPNRVSSVKVPYTAFRVILAKATSAAFANVRS